ncbi:S-layer family protein [Fontibacillus phaseoli]|uniref:S-layer family protein n=1 Tax=Fontibacillus phaseoli TaxID=1416533 RepID=A0A369BCA0_9BACL|nr:S-layer homology domain-containing protein [Fontibacillus phaseoli]RCX18228.1 S-layer family protein [Fontibacillus phaseoli]
MNELPTRKGTRNWRRLCLLWAAACLAGSSGALTVVPARTAAAEGAVMSGAVSKSDSSVSGGTVVWLNRAVDGETQIYTRDEVTGSVKAITTRNTAKDVPYIQGTTVVWADKGDQDPASANWDIYSYDLSTGVEQKLNRRAGEYANPSVDGSGVVWSDNQKYGRIVYHDLATGAEASLGEGRYPVLVNGRVIYKNARDGGLSVLELDSGVTRSLVSLGGSHAVDWFVTNGEYVLYKQKNGSLESKYAVVFLQDQLAEPQDLTPMTSKQEEYAFMSIGDTQAAFLVNEGGQAVLKGVNLATAKIYSLGETGSGKKYIGFSGDRLVYAQTDGSLGSLDLGKYNTGPAAGEGPTSSTGSSSSPSGSTSGDSAAKASAKFTIGPEGGTASLKDGRVRLEVASGIFAEETEITLTELERAGLPLKDEKGRVLEAAGAVWNIQAAGDFGKKAQLALAYDDEAYWTGHREKLGIYRYDNALGYWTYIGGATSDSNGRIVRTSIGLSGTYAVLLRKVSFGDLNSSHWAVKEVEVLAARGIVDGMGADAFAPKDTLTRAQFSKMLAGALGISPVTPAQPTFRDVASAKWSFGWVEAAAAAGIAEGDQGLFRPEDALTREQMMAMLVRAAEERLGEGQQQEAGLDKFEDRASISAWALPLVEQAVSLHLVEGSGDRINARATTTRAEAATVVYRLLERIGQL